MRSVIVALVSLSIGFPSGAAFAQAPGPSPAPTAVATPEPTPALAHPVPAAALPAMHSSEPQVSPNGALWRSAIIPGWGQRYKGEKSKGWVLTGLAAGLLAGTVAAYAYDRNAHNAYENLGPTTGGQPTPESTFESDYRTEVNAQVLLDLVGAATAGVWVYSVADSAFTPLEHLRIKEAKVKDVFPAQYKYYENNPFATISLENRSNEMVSRVRLKIEAKDIMDLPAESDYVDQIPPGLGKSLSVTAAFNNKIFSVGASEPRAVPAKITIEYEVGNKKRQIVRTSSFTVYNRNAIVWDDMRKLASFVTARDEGVKTFADAVIRKNGNASGVAKISEAAALFDALTADGIIYKSDPNAPFSYFEGNAEAVDLVLFPRETLDSRTGNCAVLTALYASLLENVGIATALVDVPGHTFTMFDSGLSAEEMAHYAGTPYGYQMRHGTAWLPIETTSIGKSFSEAWQLGTEEMKKWDGLKKFNVVETEPSQQEFPPSPPDFGPVTAAVTGSLNDKAFADLTVHDRGNLMGTESKAQQEAIAAVHVRHLPEASEANEIGIIYAKDGVLDKAETNFRKAIALNAGLAKAHNNLANILYLENKNTDAAAEYVKALETGGENAAILANLANLYYEQGDAKQAIAYFDRAVHIEPGYERDYPEIAALLKPSGANAGALATAPTKTNGTKAANLGNAAKDPRHSRWIP